MSTMYRIVFYFFLYILHEIVGGIWGKMKSPPILAANFDTPSPQKTQYKKPTLVRKLEWVRRTARQHANHRSEFT